MEKRRKAKRGDKVMHQSKEWTVCEGGFSDPHTKSYNYKLMRGAWKKFVSGNCIKTYA